MSKHTIGAGYSDIINERITAGTSRKNLENKAHPEWTIYIGRTHVTDHETGDVSRGLLKIGRAKFVNTIQRGRNQGGADFRIYARIIVNADADTYAIEKLIAEKYKDRKIAGPQNQTELYDFDDGEIKDIVKTIVDNVDNSVVKLVKFYI